MASRHDRSRTGVRRSLKKRSNPDTGGSRETRDDSARAGRILRERARALAKPFRGAEPELPSMEILMFRLGGANFGLPTSFAREVVSEPKLVPLPRASGFLLGICAVHGGLLPVFDLSRLLELPPETAAPDRRLIVVGEKAPEFGLLVEEVSPSRPLPLDDALSAAASEHHFVRGITPDGTVILDGRALLSDPRLFL